MATAPLAASFAPIERELIDDLVNLADTAMYAAKHAGGNQSRSAYIPHADLKVSPA
jgi:GGDEF domain-containing protein